MHRLPPRRGAPLLWLALLAPVPALAGGIDLSWDDCGAFGVAQKNFACNVNSGTHVLCVSAIPSVAMAALNGAECTLQVTSELATLPAWWQLQSGGCRAGFLFYGVDFLAGPFNCRDPWEGNAVAGGIFDYPVSGLGPERGRIRTISALPAGLEQPADTSTELYLMKVTLGHQRTVGPAACAGCTAGACIVLQSVRLNGPSGVPSFLLTTAALRQHVLWQAGGSVVGGCPAATPARARTWGAVKSMYR